MAANKKTFKEYKQGIFTPINKKKFIGKDGVAIYRSGLELSLMRILDANPNVVEWSSEEGVCIIPYIKPTTGKPARYFVDIYAKIKVGDIIKKYLIEIKPYRQTFLKKHGNAKPSTILYDQIEFTINSAKWLAAEAYCKKKGDIEFKLITEKDIDSLR
jgi:hypothetical protein